MSASQQRRNRELHATIDRLTGEYDRLIERHGETQEENTRLEKLRAAVTSTVAAVVKPHPEHHGVNVCSVCHTAAAGIEHERWCWVGPIALALAAARKAA